MINTDEALTKPMSLEEVIQEAFDDPDRGMIAEAEAELALTTRNAVGMLQQHSMMGMTRAVHATVKARLCASVRDRAEMYGWTRALTGVRRDVEHMLRASDEMNRGTALDRAAGQERLHAYGRFLIQVDALFDEHAEQVLAYATARAQQVSGRRGSPPPVGDRYDDPVYTWQREYDDFRAEVLELIATGVGGADKLAALAIEIEKDAPERIYAGGRL